MRHWMRIVLAAAVLCLFVSVPNAYTTNDNDYIYRYYDSYQQVVGIWEEDCDHVETSEGTLDGEWLEIEMISCSTIGRTYEYYHKCNGAWHPVGFVGSTAC